jgi:hypothetical protein
MFWTLCQYLQTLTNLCAVNVSDYKINSPIKHIRHTQHLTRTYTAVSPHIIRWYHFTLWGGTTSHYQVVPLHISGSTTSHYQAVPLHIIRWYHLTLSGSTTSHYQAVPLQIIRWYHFTLSGSTASHYQVIQLHIIRQYHFTLSGGTTSHYHHNQTLQTGQLGTLILTPNGKGVFHVLRVTACMHSHFYAVIM